VQATALADDEVAINAVVTKASMGSVAMAKKASARKKSAVAQKATSKQVTAVVLQEEATSYRANRKVGTSTSDSSKRMPSQATSIGGSTLTGINGVDDISTAGDVCLQHWHRHRGGVATSTAPQPAPRLRLAP